MMNDFRSKTGQKAFFSSLLSVWSDQYSRAARVAAIARDGAKLTALMIIRLIVPGPNVATEQPAPG
ncbi:hypothetical protein CG51_18925 [Haematobacter missouriensis]|uniref:Uncharacterized protein n=2 Tax=Haematobacter missouriensis TaxID=366616 RepID=A0A212AMG6_9RHOB|nr:hypothetical protein CG51_18925 [Haematobacter missouriensis]OWJ73157.1 hypothetical protein CDV53_16410 [Haematobacter missouriensis]OWJ82526.1 hypothetical protein CDV52_14055 [Haematobacter missouriensis]